MMEKLSLRGLELKRSNTATALRRGSVEAGGTMNKDAPPPTSNCRISVVESLQHSLGRLLVAGEGSGGSSGYASMSDVTFLVGRERRPFLGHRLLFAAQSEPFHGTFPSSYDALSSINLALLTPGPARSDAVWTHARGPATEQRW